jgi:hypothetical protein
VNFENRYGLLDRALHRVAFATGRAHVGLADLEERLFGRELAAVPAERPILVTALPRAGTTVLLELLARTPTLAAHTYRDMPFVLCPLLWERLSRAFRRAAEAPRERAHGDGLAVGLDSPEAFEEMVWKVFFRDRYRADRILPWTGCGNREFVAFLRGHLRRIVALRRRQKPSAARYVSKNNLNLARLPALWQALPDALVVVPFREPVQHAASLRHQHRRFLELHARDAFARRYMAGIGHFDFGANLKPVDFGGWLDVAPDRDPERLAFWLAYWRAAYRHVLEQAGDGRLALVGFEVLGAGPDLAALAGRLELEPADLAAHRGLLKPARAHEVELDGVPPDLLREVRDLHATLRSRALF